VHAPNGRWGYGKQREIVSSQDNAPGRNRLSKAAFVANAPNEVMAGLSLDAVPVPPGT
jgi:hypothetical protein